MVVQVDTTTICGTDLHILRATGPLSSTGAFSLGRIVPCHYAFRRWRSMTRRSSSS